MSIEFPPDPKQVRKEIHKALKPFGLTAADPVGAVMDAVVSPLLEELEATAADASRRFEQWQEEKERADANVRLAHEASNHEMWRERAERDALREQVTALQREVAARQVSLHTYLDGPAGGEPTHEDRLHAALANLDAQGVDLNALTVDELHQMLTTAMRGPAGGERP